MNIGYARVSIGEQTLDLQTDALEATGCESIHTDVISGTKESRPGLDNALLSIRKGDTLVVWRLDRLGRSLKHLIQVVTDLQERGVGFRSLTEQINTTTSGGTLIFQVFGVLAEFERDLIQERTKCSNPERSAAFAAPMPVAMRRSIFEIRAKSEMRFAVRSSAFSICRSCSSRLRNLEVTSARLKSMK